jgi:hypothetical protein
MLGELQKLQLEAGEREHCARSDWQALGQPVTRSSDGVATAGSLH